MKFYGKREVELHDNRRSPCGERGLKSPLRLNLRLCQLVAPRAGSVD